MPRIQFSLKRLLIAIALFGGGLGLLRIGVLLDSRTAPLPGERIGLGGIVVVGGIVGGWILSVAAVGYLFQRNWNDQTLGSTVVQVVISSVLLAMALGSYIGLFEVVARFRARPPVGFAGPALGVSIWFVITTVFAVAALGVLLTHKELWTKVVLGTLILVILIALILPAINP